MAVARRTGSMLEKVVSRSLGSTQASSRAVGGVGAGAKLTLVGGGGAQP